MRKIISGIEFCKRGRYDCTQQALDVVLQFYGYKVEDILFDEWRFVYRRGGTRGVYISPGALNMRQKFSDYGIPLLFKQAADREEAWSAMKSLIDKGKPTPVLADMYYLDYYSPHSGQNHHALHYVILVGYDEEQGIAQIVDPSPWQRFKGEILLRDFERALDLSAFHQMGSNLWLEFEFPSQPVSHTPNVLRAKIRRNVEAMLEGGRAVNTFWGMKGVRAFAQEVERWASIEREVLIGYMKACFDDLTKMVERLDGHSHFLTSSATILENNDLKEIALEVDKLAQSWVIPRNMFRKAEKKEPLAMLPRIHHRLLDIADREEQVLMALKEAVGT